MTDFSKFTMRRTNSSVKRQISFGACNEFRFFVYRMSLRRKRCDSLQRIVSLDIDLIDFCDKQIQQLDLYPDQHAKLDDPDAFSQLESIQAKTFAAAAINCRISAFASSSSVRSFGVPLDHRHV